MHSDSREVMQDWTNILLREENSFFKLGNEIDEYYLNFTKACNYSNEQTIASWTEKNQTP